MVGTSFEAVAWSVVGSVLGGLVTSTQAGVVSVWSLDGWYCL